MTAPVTQSAWTPLKNATFRSIWIATVVANIGGWMQDVGAIYVMTTLTSSPLAISLVQLTASVPLFLLALPAGALADRGNRRTFLLFCSGWMLVTSSLFGVLVLQGAMTPTLLLLGATLFELGAAAEAPAWQATTPDLVGPEELQEAISLGGLGINIARFIGPTLGGVIIAAMGPAPVFFLNALSSLGVIAVLVRWKPVAVPPNPADGSLWLGIKNGVEFVFKETAFQAVLARVAAFCFSASAVWALFPAVVRIEMKLGPIGYGIMVAAFGSGALVGAWCLPAVRAVLKDRQLLAVACVILAASLVGVGIFRTPIPLAISLLTGGTAWITAVSTFNGAAQRLSPAWIRARAMAVYIMAFYGSLSVGSLVWGNVARVTSTRTALLGGATMLFGAGIYLFAQKLPPATRTVPAPLLGVTAIGAPPRRSC